MQPGIEEEKHIITYKVINEKKFIISLYKQTLQHLPPLYNVWEATR